MYLSLNGDANFSLAPFPPRSIGIPAVITQPLLTRIGDVGDHLGDPVQGVHGSSHAFGGPVVDLPAAGQVTDPCRGKTGAQDVGGQAFEGLWLIRFHGRAAVDVKTAVAPVRDVLGKLGAEAPIGTSDHSQDFFEFLARQESLPNGDN